MPCTGNRSLGKLVFGKNVSMLSSFFYNYTGIGDNTDLREAVTSVLRAVVEKTLMCFENEGTSSSCMFSPDFTVKTLFFSFVFCLTS